MSFPEFKPALRYAWVDQDERVWILLESAGAAAQRWILIDADGRPRGRLDLPPRSRLLWSRGDELWLLDPDELDVPWLVHHRIGS